MFEAHTIKKVIVVIIFIELSLKKQEISLISETTIGNFYTFQFFNQKNKSQ